MVCGNATGVCGWEQLMNADVIGAAYNMYNDALLGWPVAILFVIFQFMLYMKAKNLPLNFITGAFFVSMYALTPVVKLASLNFMWIILVFELVGIIYMWLT